MIKYRLAKFSDWKNICNECKEDFKNSKLSVIPITNRTVFKQNIEKKQMILAEENNKIIGLIQFNKRKTDGIYHITNLWVNKEYRRQNIGSKLLNLVPQPQELNCIANNPAIHFYLKNHFKIKSTSYNKNNKKIVKLSKGDIYE